MSAPQDKFAPIHNDDGELLPELVDRPPVRISDEEARALLEAQGLSDLAEQIFGKGTEEA